MNSIQLKFKKIRLKYQFCKWNFMEFIISLKKKKVGYNLTQQNATYVRKANNLMKETGGKCRPLYNFILKLVNSNKRISSSLYSTKERWTRENLNSLKPVHIDPVSSDPQSSRFDSVAKDFCVNSSCWRKLFVSMNMHPRKNLWLSKNGGVEIRGALGFDLSRYQRFMSSLAL